MKNHESKNTDELRPEYKRSDFGELVRGKYATQVSEDTNIIILEPDVSEAFPNDKAVNEALRGLLKIMQTTRLSSQSSRPPTASAD